MKITEVLVGPVEGRHGADGQQQVEQRLGWVGQWMVLLQQVGQCCHLVTRQHVHNGYIPHRVASQEAMRKQTDHSVGEKQRSLSDCLLSL